MQWINPNWLYYGSIFDLKRSTHLPSEPDGFRFYKYALTSGGGGTRFMLTHLSLSNINGLIDLYRCVSYITDEYWRWSMQNREMEKMHAKSVLVLQYFYFLKYSISESIWSGSQNQVSPLMCLWQIHVNKQHIRDYKFF